MPSAFHLPAASARSSRAKRWILLVFLSVLLLLAALAIWGLMRLLSVSSVVPDDIAAAARPTSSPASHHSRPSPDSAPKSSTRASPPIGSTKP